ncbi:MAG TPA: TIGR03617 family F420-dependent LLM class oxidoreductase [candidate division Zixibacteria bacterium]|nr:TIGR03617 family F420-dependent LLM class oxidoreductase [candidate division Zixibacteria bacterium]
MKFDTGLLVHDLSAMPAIARAAEALGFDGLWTFETAHDAFLPLVLAAEHSRRLTLGTSIAVAFSRSPTVLAYVAWDLARFSRGRFILGLGTQVKGHNERRFGVKWERPVDKMRDVIGALRAIWDCWRNRTRLDYRGEFFKLDLMTPFFSPPPHDYARIPIYLAGVNRRMCELAGELCDGFHAHPLSSARYLREAVLPNIRTGLARSGRERSSIEICSSIFVIPDDDPAEASRHEAEVRRQIAFYASTPVYRPVLALHGWGETADRLRRMAARGDWKEMGGLITDEMLETFALRGSWAELPAMVRRRYDGLLDRVSYYFPFVPGENDPGWKAAVAGFRAKVSE